MNRRRNRFTLEARAWSLALLGLVLGCSPESALPDSGPVVPESVGLEADCPCSRASFAADAMGPDGPVVVAAKFLRDSKSLRNLWVGADGEGVFVQDETLLDGRGATQVRHDMEGQVGPEVRDSIEALLGEFDHAALASHAFPEGLGVPGVTFGSAEDYEALYDRRLDYIGGYRLWILFDAPAISKDGSRCLVRAIVGPSTHGASVTLLMSKRESGSGKVWRVDEYIPVRYM